MPYLNRADARIAYQLEGDPGRPVLALAHSLGVNQSMWQPLLPLLLPDWQVLRFDLRGHGASSVTPAPLSVETLGQDLLALADHLGLSQFSFCGVSLGGLIGQWLGIHAAPRIRQLFLANTAMKFGEASAWNARIDLVSAEGLAPVVAGTLQRWFTPDFLASQPARIAPVRQMLESSDPQGYIAGCSAVRDADFRTTACRIAAPTLVLAGTSDPVSTPADGHALAAQIPGAGYVELAAAHLACVEVPDAFAAALLGFASAG